MVTAGNLDDILFKEILRRKCKTSSYLRTSFIPVLVQTFFPCIWRRAYQKFRKKQNKKLSFASHSFVLRFLFLFLIYKAAQRDLNFINCLNESSD